MSYVRAFILHYFHHTFHSVLESSLQLHLRGQVPFIIGGINIGIKSFLLRLCFRTVQGDPSIFIYVPETHATVEDTLFV